MTEQEHETQSLDHAAEPVIERRRAFPIVWVVPFVALLIGAWLAIKHFSSQGPSILIIFQSAEGLEEGRTRIKYKDVDVGKIERIHLAKDLRRVEVRARLERDFAKHLSRNTRFWVVRARVTAGQVSGLGTLLSGAYIGVDPGELGEATRTFEGLDTPPIVNTGEPGQSFTLQTDKLGSINTGSPVYYRNIKVGEVSGYHLSQDGQTVMVQVFIRAPHAALVRKDTRFWNAGGFEVALDTSGFKMSSDSLMTTLLGGIAFENPISLDASEAFPPGQIFVLYPSHDKIYEKTYLEKHYYVLNFSDSVRGLTRGSPVEFRGIKIGEVVDIKLELRANKLEVRIPVLVAIEPERMTILGRSKTPVDAVMAKMVDRGLRGQLKMGSLLTGQLFVDLDLYPKEAARHMTRDGAYAEIPTIPTTLGTMTANLNTFLDNLQRLPLDEIAQELKRSLPALREAADQAKTLMSRMDTDVVPQAKTTLEQAEKSLRAMETLLGPGAPLTQDLRKTLEEFSRTARSLRELTDYLEQHPEAVLFGKGKEP